MFKFANRLMMLLAAVLFVSCDIFERYNDFNTDVEGKKPIFHSRLGSLNDILSPAVGLAGTCPVESFAAGRFGNGYRVTNGMTDYVSFPKEIIQADRGCIEFWAKIDGIDFNSTIPWGSHPGFVVLTAGNCKYHIILNGNDGWGAGGLDGWAGNGNATTNFFVPTRTYNQILGDASAWHHYALSWDINGVKGSTWNLQLYLDGKPVGGSSGTFFNGENHNATSFPLPDSGSLLLGINDSFAGNLTIDNLKIWNYAKTDFSDRMSE